MLRVAALVGVLLVASVASGQERPKESKLFRSLGLSHYFVTSLDVAQTARFMERERHYEGNPLARPFAGRPETLLPIALGATVGTNWATSRIYRRHPKLATALRLIVVGVHVGVVTRNAVVASR